MFNKKNRKIIFISWIAHNRRSQLISKELHLKLYAIQSLKRLYILAPIRYILQGIKSFIIMVKDKPDLIFVQNPPIFAPLIVYLYTIIRKSKYIIDSHTGALLAPWWRWTLPIHSFLSRRALTTIVTNEHLRKIITSWNANAFTLADIPTAFPSSNGCLPLKGDFNIVVINTFSPDEPIKIILKAAAALPDINFYITGDTIRAKKEDLINHPENITFTGFLPDDQYISLLRSVQAIMVLTTDNHTMQRGACEALSLGQPIITSNWPVLKQYFNRGTIFVNNTVNGIREGVLKMGKNRSVLKKEIMILKKESIQEWRNKSFQLLRMIEDGLQKKQHKRL
jgi:glycosyltransferase involved in cell wall biosynthesis